MAMICNPHIERPVREFRVRYHHEAYRCDGVPELEFPAETKVDVVLAETPDGALEIARYHRCLFGSQFQVLEGEE